MELVLMSEFVRDVQVEVSKQGCVVDFLLIQYASPPRQAESTLGGGESSHQHS
jgi:hypothetical protein